MNESPLSSDERTLLGFDVGGSNVRAAVAGPW